MLTTIKLSVLIPAGGSVSLSISENNAYLVGFWYGFANACLIVDAWQILLTPNTLAKESEPSLDFPRVL